jgi:dihydroxyacetone kinase-like predicted kinase
MSWRMMLRSKSGSATYKVENHTTKKNYTIKLSDYLSKKQQRLAQTKPDVMWQFCQRIKHLHKEKNEDISIYITSYVSVNGKRYKAFTDPKIDVANQDWNYFGHTDWLLPSDLY